MNTHAHNSSPSGKGAAAQPRRLTSQRGDGVDASVDAAVVAEIDLDLAEEVQCRLERRHVVAELARQLLLRRQVLDVAQTRRWSLQLRQRDDVDEDGQEVVGACVTTARRWA
jgi:hypothetical protein